MIEQIEVAIVEAIKGEDFGYPIPVVDSYGGELTSDPEQMAVIAKTFPAVWVHWSWDERVESLTTSRKKWLVWPRFTVLVATRTARAEKFTRHSASAAEVGAYQIMADIRTLLVGRDLGLEIDPFVPEPGKRLFNGRIRGQAMTVLAIDFRSKYVVEQVDPEGVPWLATRFSYFGDATSTVLVAEDDFHYASN